MAVQVINGPGLLNGPSQLQTVAPPGYQRAYAQTNVQVVRQGVMRPAPFAQWIPLVPGTDSQYSGALYGSPFGDTPLIYPQRADDRGVIQVWAAEPVELELQVFVYGYAQVRQLLQLQFTEDPGDTALDALATHIADPNDPHAAAGYITQTEADDQFLTADEADALFLTQAEGDARYSMVNVSGITKTQADGWYVNLEGDVMSGTLTIGTPTLLNWNGYLGVELGQSGSVVAQPGGDGLIVGSNVIYDGSYRTLTNGPTGYYQQSGGEHSWYTTPTAAAGAAVSPVRRMYLHNSGMLELWTTAASTASLVLRADAAGTAPRIIVKTGDLGPAWNFGFGSNDEWQTRAESTVMTSLSRGGTMTLTPSSGNPALFCQVGAGVEAFRATFFEGPTGNLVLKYGNGAGHTQIASENGMLELAAAGGVVGPAVDNTYLFGYAGSRWIALYAVAGSINTSSIKYKDHQGDLDPESALAAVLRTPARRFRYKGTERVQSGYYMEEADPLFTIGPEEASPSNDAGVLLAAVQALAARMGITPGVTP